MSTPSWPRRTSADTSGDVQRVLSRQDENYPAIPEVVRVLANSDAMFLPWMLLATALVRDSAVPPRVREIIVLRLAADLDCTYMHMEHVPIAERAGVSAAEFDYAAKKGPVPDSVSAVEREAVELAVDLVGGRALPAELYDALTQAWGPSAPMDYVFTCGFWGGMMPLVLSAVDLH